MNGFQLDPRYQAIRINSMNLALIGGKATLSEIEFISQNQHIKIVEAEISIKWWLNSKSIRTTEKVKNNNKKNTRLPFRMSVVFTGVEVSIYNNVGSYSNVYERLFALFQGHQSLLSPKTPKGETPKKGFSFEFAPQEGIFSTPPSTTPLHTGDMFNAKSMADSTNESAKEGGGASVIEDYSLNLPYFYELFPISRIMFRKCVVYLGAPTLPTVLISHVERSVLLHFTEPIMDENRGLDMYRVMNKMDMRGITVSCKPNKGYVAEEQMRNIRIKLEQERDIRVHAR